MRQVDIKGFEDYQITDDGRVWNKKSNKWLKPWLNDAGYYCVDLTKDGVEHKKRLHRIIAEAFIDNPENKPFIDHINTIRTDNSISNLRWCTRLENANNPLTRLHNSESQKKKAPFFLGKHHSEESKKKMSEAKKGCIPSNIKKVYQYTLDGELVKIWNSTCECGENGFHQGNVSACCRNKYLRENNNKYKGHRWSYKPL